MILYTCMFICNAVCIVIICDLLYIRTVSYAITLIEFIFIKESIKCQELLARYQKDIFFQMTHILLFSKNSENETRILMCSEIAIVKL